MKTQSLDEILMNESPAEVTAESGTSWQQQVPTDASGIVKKGGIFVFGFLAVFFVWSTLFPIASAVVSSGKIVSAGQNKLIQHPTGGVVQEILVEDGSTVEEGQVLLVLDPSGSQAELTSLVARQNMLSALKSRLEAEASGGNFGNTIAVSGLQLRGAQQDSSDGADTTADAVAIAAEAAAAAAAAADQTNSQSRVLAEQQIEFDAGRKRLNAELDAATYQIESLKDQRSGLVTRLEGSRQLLEFTEMEIKKTRPLVEDGYLAKSRLWDLDKRRLEQISQIGNLEAEVEATNQKVLEAEAKLAQLSEADREKRSEELTSVITELEQIRDQLGAARSSLNLTELRAPTAGTIVKMAAHTNGGVIKGGEVVAEIVPQDSGLETEFRVSVADVDNVNVGQNARIVITAFNRRTYDPIEGRVSYVSADSSLDEATGETFFLARARMTPNPEKNLGLEEIQAGMATEVFAEATPRVFMSYALQPIFDSMDRSFRETN
ncbi:MAG: HlyD family type I secretion periplasmic adaptor subunit [Rhizobiaceae bacterium]